jgi:hypothetical protein
MEHVLGRWRPTLEYLLHRWCRYTVPTRRHDCPAEQVVWWADIVRLLSELPLPPTGPVAKPIRPAVDQARQEAQMVGQCARFVAERYVSDSSWLNTSRSAEAAAALLSDLLTRHESVFTTACVNKIAEIQDREFRCEDKG